MWNSREIAMGAGMIGVWVLLAGVARASHPLATDDTGTQDTAGVEIELSTQACRPVSEGEVLIGNGVVVGVGLARALDAGLVLGFESTLADADWTHGLADPEVFVKYRLSEGGGWMPSFGLRLDYKAPQGSSDASGGHDLGCVLIASWERERTAVHFNLGSFARAIDATESRWALFVSGTTLVQVADGLFAAGELVYEPAPMDRAHRLASVAGVAWELQPGRALSFGVGPLWETDGRLGWLATVGLTLGFRRE